ncbi:MAG: hypothetical protein ACTHMI_23890 [Mucilaginibacter sp.]
MESIDLNEPMPDDKNSGKQKKPYQTPKIQRFGGLAELVQHMPGTGPDGEIRWIDCTSL